MTADAHGSGLPNVAGPAARASTLEPFVVCAVVSAVGVVTALIRGDVKRPR